MSRRKRHLGHRGHRKHQPLRITSMMDILTVLLLFLLKSFVVDGEAHTPAAGVELPLSSSTIKPESSIVIAINGGDILVANELVARVTASNANTDMMIEELADRLEATRDQTIALHGRRGDEVEFDGKITIQGDRDMPFQILQRVMFTCNMIGYDNIALAVIQSS